MTKRMLVDATHPEEVRVAIVQDQRLIDLDIETCTKAQIKGNIYLGRVTRVEPSLQAAFVDFNDGRQGFLSVNDINPKYYPPEFRPEPDPIEDMDEQEEPEDLSDEMDGEEGDDSDDEPGNEDGADDDASQGDASSEAEAKPREPSQSERPARRPRNNERANRGNRRRHIPIQDILKKGQLLLLQVVKEARGTKGASLTTNISLAGRYTVLLPENSGGGGISRKIMDNQARKALKTMLTEMEIPQEVSLIIRTAGMERTKREIARDMSYLTRLWKTIQEKVEQHNTPTLIHEEGDLIIRTIRDLYSTDMEEILIDGGEAYRRGKDFMRLLMPRYVKAVQPYKDRIPLFSRYQVEHQIESMHERTISLKAGGYLVIEPTEALVSIDINSGRSTKEKNVENTAFKTNMQAVDEIARQLRLRDLGGLIVIDFIDMEEKKHNLEVEKRLKEALKGDRAKIQLGKISQFGLLELSRQRMKPAFNESNREVCPRCTGLGTIRSVESTAIRLFRCIEEDISSGRFSKLIYFAPADVANYLHNRKRFQMVQLEQENNLELLIEIDPELQTPHFRKERIARPVQDEPVVKERPEPEEPTLVSEEDEPQELMDDAAEGGEENRTDPKKRKRRRKRRRGGREREEGAMGEETTSLNEEEMPSTEAPAMDDEADDEGDGDEQANPSESAETTPDSPSKRRRRRRRRRRSTSQEESAPRLDSGDEEQAIHGDEPSPSPEDQPQQRDEHPVTLSDVLHSLPTSVTPLLMEEPDTPQPVLLIDPPTMPIKHEVEIETPQPSVLLPEDPQPAIVERTQSTLPGLEVEPPLQEQVAVKKPVRRRRKPAVKKPSAETAESVVSAQEVENHATASVTPAAAENVQDKASIAADPDAGVTTDVAAGDHPTPSEGAEPPKQRRRSSTPRKRATPKADTAAETAAPTTTPEAPVVETPAETPAATTEAKPKAVRAPRKRTATPRKRATAAKPAAEESHQGEAVPDEV
ncbi:RNAse E [Magnetococcus marinus MC-1]|uniref:Ribonuclease G n=1 Tax=Magnetococcus marinus (strain ATCC BAA-1437 / JCM 17883 / MC-1) TaxID=156889 RepID=A0L8J1_MAGMM|nr:ribonuclease E/G [Magnetococcus marinus]ABK44284.1 RNAse E [Magnetococcus marinus MC-1]